MIQINFRVQPVCLGGLQQSEDDDTGVGSGLGITEQQVLSAHNNGGPNRVLYLIVADFNGVRLYRRAGGFGGVIRKNVVAAVAV